jgi:YVTN family beta-propeller protein
MKVLILIAEVLLSSIITCAQSDYTHDRVYTANQISNTVSVIDPSTNMLLGEIKLGKPYPNVLNPLYKGQALVHGLRYCAAKRLLAVVSIGSNSVTFISTENNQVLKTLYIGRSPHEPTFTPDNKQVWVSVRGEAYISVIDVNLMKEIKRVPVADGPGMVAFTPDGKLAYVCSSFTPELDIVNTSTLKIIKRIPVTSPFSPNIFTSPDGKWIALTHKDVGKVTVVNTRKMAVEKVITTGAITNHVTFSIVDNILLMMVTVGGENKVRIFDVANNFLQRDTINAGALPHGIWPSADGKLMYIGIEYGDQVQAINLQNMSLTATIQIGQSPQALVYADNAVTDLIKSVTGLSPLNDTASTQVIVLNNLDKNDNVHGWLSVRGIGLADLVEQAFSGLQPNNSYTLALSKSLTAPFLQDYQINTFLADGGGKYAGQSTGLIKELNTQTSRQLYRHVVLINNASGRTILLDNIPAAN